MVKSKSTVKNMTELYQIFNRAAKFKLLRVQVNQFRAGPNNDLRMQLFWMKKTDKGAIAQFSHESDDVIDLIDALDGMYDQELWLKEHNKAKEEETLYEEDGEDLL